MSRHLLPSRHVPEACWVEGQGQGSMDAITKAGGMLPHQIQLIIPHFLPLSHAPSGPLLPAYLRPPPSWHGAAPPPN